MTPTGRFHPRTLPRRDPVKSLAVSRSRNAANLEPGRLEIGLRIGFKELRMKLDDLWGDKARKAELGGGKSPVGNIEFPPIECGDGDGK